NLIDNALRYSHESTGKYWAGLIIETRGQEKIASLNVQDNGPGVPRKQMEKLFEPFFTTSREGSGLGLYIARELCQINFATLTYHPPKAYKPGFFRIGFA